MARAVSQSVRAFSGTSQRQDTGIPPELLERMKDTALYKKLEARPEAIKAVSNMVTVLTDAGTLTMFFASELCIDTACA